MSIGTELKKRLNATPKKYQIQAARALEKANGRFILADDMGLGKTLESICWLALHPEITRVIIVCPAQVKYQWQSQLKMHAGIVSDVAEGRKPYPLHSDTIIINYAILAIAIWPEGKRKKGARPKFPWVQFLKNHKPQAIIIDEFHYIKDRAALRTKATKQLCRNVPHVIGASGTPIDKAPVEFFPILQIIAPCKFNSFWNFAQEYCDLKAGFRGWDYSGASNLDKLHEEVKPFMIRRLKKDVAKELPSKIRSIVPVKINNLKEYNKAKTNYLQWVEDTKGPEAADKASGAISLTKIGALKRLTAEGKIQIAKSWIQDFLRTENKLVTFCVHRKILNMLRDLFPGSASIAGDSRNRSKEIHRFINDKKCPLFIGQLRASGVGIDGLQLVASSALFVEIGWGWNEHEQAEDRILRIGQNAKSVNIFYMIGKNTVEEPTMDLLQGKHDIRQMILNGDLAPEILFHRKETSHGIFKK